MSRATYWLLNDRVTVLADAADNGGQYGLLEVTCAVGDGPPPHIHDDCSETFFVLSGQMRVLVEGKWTDLKVGDSATAPRGTMHTFSNPGPEPVTALVIIRPGGFERFFHEMGLPCERHATKPPPITDAVVQRILAEAHKYKMRFVL